MASMLDSHYVASLVIFACSRFGDIKLGPPDEPPKYGNDDNITKNKDNNEKSTEYIEEIMSKLFIEYEKSIYNERTINNDTEIIARDRSVHDLNNNVMSEGNYVPKLPQQLLTQTLQEDINNTNIITTIITTNNGDINEMIKLNLHKQALNKANDITQSLQSVIKNRVIEVEILKNVMHQNEYDSNDEEIKKTNKSLSTYVKLNNTLMTWFSMLFSACIGVGLYYFGVAEPLWHLCAMCHLTINQQAMEALNISWFHWGFTATATYCAAALGEKYTNGIMFSSIDTNGNTASYISSIDFMMWVNSFFADFLLVRLPFNVSETFIFAILCFFVIHLFYFVYFCLTF